MNYVVELDVGSSTYYANVERSIPTRIGDTPVYIDNVFDPSTQSTFQSLVFRKKTDNTPYLNTGATPNSSSIPSQLVAQARVSFGKFNYDSVSSSYVVSGHTSSNSSWIKVGNESANPTQRNSTSYSNASYPSLPTPYDTINSPNSNTLKITYNSNMPSTITRSVNTEPTLIKAYLDATPTSYPSYSFSVSDILSKYIRPRTEFYFEKTLDRKR